MYNIKETLEEILIAALPDNLFTTPLGQLMQFAQSKMHEALYQNKDDNLRLEQVSARDAQEGNINDSVSRVADALS